MKKMKNFNLKVLFILLVLPLMLMAGILLVACADKNYSARFKKDEYTLSIGQRVDITKDVELENITLQDLYFNSSDPSILSVETTNPLESNSKTEIKAHKAGDVVLYVYLRGETLDTVNVTVKKQFEAPTNIRVSESGLIEWNAVSAIHDGKEVQATYNVFVAKSENDYKNITTENTYYQLTERGRYFVCVQAIGTKYIDSSEDSDIVELYYQSVRSVSGFKYINIDDGENQKAKLVWNEVSGADYYRLTIGENISVEETKYEFDLAPYFEDIQKNQSLKISICACSNSVGIVDSPKQEITIKEISLENLQIEDGVLSWSKNDNATSYIVHYENLADPLIRGNFELTETSTTLDSLASGSYSISVQALGKDAGTYGIYYANSAAEKISTNVAKLMAPEFEYFVNDNVVTFKVSTSRSEIKNFLVKFTEQGTQEVIEKKVTITNDAVAGVFSVTDQVELNEVGKYNVSVSALSAGMNSIIVNGHECSSILNSKETTELTIYKLPAIGTINHSYDQDQNSTISFAKSTYETKYNVTMDYVVKVNGHEVEIQSKTLSPLGNYFLNIGKITTEYQNPSNPLIYVITIETSLSSLAEKNEFMGATSAKTLTMLEVTLMNLKGNELTENYTYSARNTTGYTYTLYSTTNTFAEKGSVVSTADDNYGVMAKPEAGYYIIDVVAYTNNANQFLHGMSSDYFYVKTELESPVLDFGKTTTKIENEDDILDTTLMSGYYVEINVVENATNYDILLDGTKLANVVDADEDGKIYYYFAKEHDFTSGNHTIAVEAKGDDDFLYVSATETIEIEKLETPQNPQKEGQALKFTYGEGQLRFYKNSVVASNVMTVNKTNSQTEGMFDYVIDMTESMTDFKLIVYADKEAEENAVYYIPSDQIEFNIHKVTTMTDFYFSKDKVYFTYNDTNDYLALTPDVKNDKIELIAIVSLLGASNSLEAFEFEIQSLIDLEEENVYSFELMDLIENMIADNPEFESLYLQRDSIRLELVVRASHYEEDKSTYVFSSQKAVSSANVEQSFITIEKIYKPLISFSESQKIAYWSDEEDKFEYTITINGEETAQQAIYNVAEERYEFDLSTYFVSKTPIVIQIKKSADNYLDSDWSNEIGLYFLSQVSYIDVITDIEGRSYARFTYHDNNIDKSKIEINVNNNEELVVSHDATFTSYEFELVSSVVSYIINVKGYNESDASNNVVYYVGSASVPFVLQKLPEVAVTEEFTILDSVMTWKEYSEVDTPRYQVYFSKDGNVCARIVVEDVNLSLTNETLYALSAGTYEASVYAINKNFSINAGGSGYYGGTIISQGNIIKLDEVSNLSVVFDENGTTIANEKSKTINLSWAWNGNYNETSNVKFEIYYNNDLSPKATIDYVSGQVNYTYEIVESDISEFNNAYKIVVISDKDIKSFATSKNMYRFSDPTLNITDEKLLTISYSVNAVSGAVTAEAFIIKVYVNGSSIREMMLTETQVDLTNIFVGYEGEYKIEAIIKGVSNEAVWSVRTASIEGTILETPEIEQTSGGVELSSGDEEVSYYIDVLRNGEKVISNALAENGKYIFPDTLLDGTYTINAIAKKSGNLTSNISTKEITISRLSEVSSISVVRNRIEGVATFETHYIISWGEVENATSYTISLYDKDGTTLYSILSTSLLITISEELFYSLIEEAGDYILGIRACGEVADGFTDAKEVLKDINFANPVEGFEILNNGNIAWKGNGSYYLYAADGASPKVKKTFTEADAKQISAGLYQYEFHIKSVAGLVNLTLVKEGVSDRAQTNVDKFYFDSDRFEGSFSKMQGIDEILLNTDNGLISITTKDSYADEIKFFFVYTDSNNVINTYECKDMVQEGNVYTTNFAKVFDALGIDEEGAIEVEVYLAKDGQLRSDESIFTFEYSFMQDGDYSPRRGVDALHDYLVILSDENKNIKQINLKIVTATKTEYLVIEASAKRGYWNVYEDGTNTFAGAEDASALTSEEVYSIFVNELEQLGTTGEYDIQVSYIYTSATTNFGFNGWSATFGYVKLPSTFNPMIENGKITWKINTTELSNNITGYYVKFTDGQGEEDLVYIASHEITEITPNHLANSLSVYNISVITINKDNTLIIASNEATQTNPVVKTENMSVSAKISSSGVLTVDMKRDGTDESYGTLTEDVVPQGTQLIVGLDAENGVDFGIPYGYGRYELVQNNDLQFREGQGTFTAINYNGKIQYIRTSFITKEDTNQYVINEDAPIYSMYNVALEDYLDENYTSKFPYQKSLLNVLSKTTFTYPFVFTLDALAKEEIKFVLTFKNTETFESKTITVNALKIIDKTTIHYSILDSLLAGQPDSSVGYAVVSAFYQTFESKANYTGVACDQYLFDDIGEDGGRKGESIDAGIYDLYITVKGNVLTSYDMSASQNGKSYTLYSLVSSPVLVCASLEVASSPSVITYREVNEDGYTYSYFLKMSPTYSNGAMLTDYTLSMSYKPEQSEDLVFTSYSIKYVLEGEGYVWKFIAGARRFNLSTVVDGLETYVMIPLNGENGLNSVSGMKKDCIYTANIYADGNATRLNSKTEPIEISLLGFDSKIKLSTKGFEWTSFESNGKTYSTNVVYKLETETEPRMRTVGASTATRVFMPDGEGLYEYIMFMTPGSIDKYSVTVESEIYIIREVYRLYSPTISISGEGIFSLQNSANNDENYNPVYKITNNVSSTLSKETELAYITSETSYRPGIMLTGQDEYKDTELTASVFNFTLEGSDVESFNITTEDNGKFKVMNYSGDLLYLSSKSVSMNSVMLKNVDNVIINDSGNIQWDAVVAGNTGSYSAIFNDGTTVMVYKVIVEYYYETGNVDENGDPVLTKDGDKIDVFYTKRTELSSDYVRGADESKDYTYKVTIVAFPCRDNAVLDGVTQDINQFTLTNPTYVDDSCMILTNSGVSLEFKRLNDVTDIAVEDGKITWKSEYYRNLENYSYTVRYSGLSGNGILPGSYEYDYTAGKFVFTVDSTQEILKSGEDYTISVFVTAKTTHDMMTSFVSSAENKVRILPKVSNTHITNTNTIKDGISIDSYDLQNYFKYYNAESYVDEIKVDYILTSSKRTLTGTYTLYYNSDASKSTIVEVRGETGSMNIDDAIIYLVSGETLVLNFTVVTTSENYLNSYTYSISLERKGWGDRDKISYNETTNQFTWTYGKYTQYYVDAVTTIWKNSAGNISTNYTFEANEVITVLSEMSITYQVWYDVNGDGVAGSDENFYILKTNVREREISKEPQDDLYYNISVKYVNSYMAGEIRVENYITKIFKNSTNEFFFPETVGLPITEFKVQVREGEMNLFSDWISYECPAYTASDAIALNLFASGEGTQENPYMIETAEQFKNMNLLGAKPSYLNAYTELTQKIERNPNTGIAITTGSINTREVTIADTKYYFALANDITLESEGDYIITDNFHSVFDGRGFTITFNSTSGVDINNSINNRYASGVDSYEEVKFNRTNSIFKRVYGEVKNVKLNLNYVYNLENVETKTLFAGLVMFNNGYVSNIEVCALSVDVSNTISSILAVAGVVGINNASVSNCIFNVTGETRISNNLSAEQKLLFGGIVGFNVGVDASITRCFVNKNVDFRVRLERSTNGIVQAGGIAISNYNGSILLCGNDGAIMGVSVQHIGYGAGIVVYSQGGSIYDCYNTGSVFGTNGYVGGVFFYSNSKIGNLIGVGSLNNKATISNFHIGGVFAGTKETTCYTKFNLEQTVGAIALTSSKNLSTKITGVTMQIVVSGSTYTITFTE